MKDILISVSTTLTHSKNPIILIIIVHPVSLKGSVKESNHFILTIIFFVKKSGKDGINRLNHGLKIV